MKRGWNGVVGRGQAGGGARGRVGTWVRGARQVEHCQSGRKGSTSGLRFKGNAMPVGSRFRGAQEHAAVAWS